MYSNVVVGVDGQQGGEDAAALAGALASDGASIVLVTVTPSDHATGRQFDLAAEGCLPALFWAERCLCGGSAQPVGIAASSTGAGLESVARQRRAGLIVVGASRRHGIVRGLAGDDVRSLEPETPCAVAVAPAGYAHHRAPIARIGVAYNGSPESEAALAQAGRLAGELSAQLQVCQVAGARGSPPRATGLHFEQLDGPVTDELVACGGRVDLLVCGSRHGGPLRQIAFGRISDHLARHLGVPLIVAPTIDTTSIELWQRASIGRLFNGRFHECLA